MPNYQPLKPAPNDFLSQSVTDIQGNFQQANTVYGTNHYDFTVQTANLGKHNNVQTPIIVGAAHPTTPIDENAFYSMEDSTNVGVLQYSRGENNAIPTPLTSLHGGTLASPITIGAGLTVNVLDCSSLNFGFFIFSGYSNNATSNQKSYIVYGVNWDGTTIRPVQLGATGAGNLSLIAAGSIITLRNNDGSNGLNNVFWTLRNLRLQK